MTLPAFTAPHFAVSRKRLAFLCAIVAVAAVLAFFAWAGTRGLFAVAGQDNQRFTELYFTSSQTIPPRLEAGRSYVVPFAIVNQQDVSTRYTYQVTVTQGVDQQRQPLQQLTLQNGERAVRDIRFVVPQAAEPATVSVRLQQPEQTISFTVEP